MVTISNGVNQYRVYVDSMKSGNVVIVGITGVDKHKAYVNTPEQYHQWKLACHYEEITPENSFV